MKKFLTVLLTFAMLIAMVPSFAVSAEAPEITVDGKSDDWAGLATLSTNLDSGAKYTFYGVLNEKGLYVAVEAYTTGFDFTNPDWWMNPNLEFFVGPRPGDSNQRWVSVTNKEGGFIKHGDVTEAAVSYESVEGVAPHHFVIEAFIEQAKLNESWFNADGSIRVGMACDTNNSPDGKGAYVRPADTHERTDRCVVNETGVYAPSDIGGINATYYTTPWGEAYWATIGKTNNADDEPSADFVNKDKFEETIDRLLADSLLVSVETGVKGIAPQWGADECLVKWTGTITAPETANWTIVGYNINNCFAMKVNGKLVYEYWGCNYALVNTHLPSDVSFEAKAGEPVEVEMYYLEMGGAEDCGIMVKTENGEPKYLDQTFDLNLTKELYYSKCYKAAAWADDAAIRGTGNGGQCEEANFHFDETFERLTSQMVKGEPRKVASFDAYLASDAYIVEYTGWMVPKISGEYTFGAFAVDNGFTMDIGDQRVYEFWAGHAWNDIGGNTYPESIKLEAGKAYPFKAYFLETGGGEVMQLNCSVDGGSKYDVSHLFSYYTECPHANVDVTGAKEATETEPGYTGDKVCKDCGATVEKGKEIPATGPAAPDTNEPSTEVPPTGDLLISMIAVAMIGAVAVFALKKKRVLG